MRRRPVPHILLADDGGFGRRGFRPLHSLAAKGAVRVRVVATRPPRSSARVRRSDYRLRLLAAMPPVELARLRHDGVELFACARNDILRRILPHWPDPIGPNRGPELVERLSASPCLREESLVALAAARDWIDFWHDMLDREEPFSHAIVPAGGSIAARSLAALASGRGMRLLTVGPSRIGRGFCVEEQHAEPPLPEPGSGYDDLRAEAHRRFRLRRGARRRHSIALMPAPFDRSGGDVVAVLGQAADDAALIEAPLPEGSVVAIYRSLIGHLLEGTDCRIVFTLECSATAGAAATLRAVAAWHGALSPTHRARLRLMPGAPLEELLRYCDWAASLSSPAMLEACAAGLKPIQFGQAFFGGKGFTHDFADADSVLSALRERRLAPQLSLGEYRHFEEFLIRALVLELIAEGSEGEAKLAALLAEPPHMPDLDGVRLDVRTTEPLWRIASDVLANPLAAWRLARDRR